MTDSAQIVELLGVQLVKKGEKGNTIATSTLDGKYVGLYFSAHWCPPCRAFTPQLCQIYERLVRAGKPFEIVFVSLDRSSSDFDGYFSEMPWVALPFGAPEQSALASRFGVSSIPTLVVLSPEGRLLSKNAKSAVQRNPDGFPWEGEEDSR